jgi:lysozyme
MREISLKGITLLKELESFRATCYKDDELLKIGYGTLIDSENERKLLNKTITPEEAEDYLFDDLIPIQNQINRLVKTPLSQNEFDALVLFCYNVGLNAFKNSTLLKLLNTTPRPNLRNEFLRWVYAGKKKCDGLVNRRTKEVNLFYGNY